MAEAINYFKHTRHLYTAKNQNGLNNALYNFFGCDISNEGNPSKENVRKMVNNVPNYYPISFVIVYIWEVNRLHLEFFDIMEEAHRAIFPLKENDNKKGI